jgi:hypothetical protein
VAYRDHSKRSLGVGSRWAVAGWSRYAGTSHARPCYSTSGTLRWSSASTSASEGRCIETTLGVRWEPARAGLLPGGLDTRHGAPSSRVAATRPAVGFAGRVARSREGRACFGRIETTLGVRWEPARAGPLPGGLDTRPRRSFLARGCYSTSGGFRWSSSRRRDEGAGGDVSRPLWAFAGSRPALSRCRVVSIRGTALLRRACRYSTSGGFRWSSSAEPRGTSVLRAYRDHSGRSLGVGPRWAVAERSRYAATAGGDVSRPLQADAGGRVTRSVRRGGCGASSRGR